jgi:hypothetical protein
MGNWDNYEKPSEKEVEYANEVAEALTEPEEESKLRLVRAGRKRTESGRADLPPFTGCSIEISDLLRQMVGHKFAGYTQREAYEIMEINPDKASSIRANHRDGYEEAIQAHMSICAKEYQANLWMLKSALSEMGSRAIRTLGAVMDDPKSSGYTKMTAAKIILKLVNVDGSVSTGNESGAPAEFLITLKDNRTGIESDSVHIVDADGVELLGDEDADRDECSSGVC